MPVETTYLRASGKSLIEALVACAVLALVGVLLVVVIAGNRSQARSFVCADNLKQLGQAAHQYAADNQGKFFPQNHIYVDVVEGVRPDISSWCDDKRLGSYIKDVDWSTWQFARHKGYKLDEAVNGVVRCPQAEEDEVRSYAQNHWANGLGLVKHKGWNFDLGIYPLGEHFDSTENNLDRLMLFVESNALLPRETRWVTRFEAGRHGRPSDRFTGGAEVDLNSPIPLPYAMPTVPPNRYEYRIPWDLDYSKHGSINDPFTAEGETHITFVDGHVAKYLHNELYDPKARVSTYEALWSVKDSYYDNIEVHYELPKP